MKRLRNVLKCTLILITLVQIFWAVVTGETLWKPNIIELGLFLGAWIAVIAQTQGRRQND